MSAHVTLLERGERVGGVWEHNAYPGIACDVPSHQYEFSSAPKQDSAKLRPVSRRR